MGSQIWKYSAVALLFVATSGCTTGGTTGDSPGERSTAEPGGIEMSVAQTCRSGSAPECISVNGEYMMILESDFLRAGVETAEAVEDDTINALDVTFDDDGAGVFQELTAEAAASEGTALLVIKVGDEVLSAVTVVEPMHGDTAMIVLPPDADANELARMLRGS
ncbi:hypothetical protein [Agromyces sp. NPDC058104]|uniref:hypothetical protein n=1 Tax=Agromyces sp. NPDC058104 TaxID=3346342 RepID=UPI0036DF170B